MEPTEASNKTTNRYMSNRNNSNSAKSTTTIEDLYKYFGILADAKLQANEHPETFIKIVSGTKGGPSEKKLASQFITRFFKHFPKEMPMALESIFDMCEDEDVNIRKAAIKDLATLSKECTVEHLNRIADILTQLLQTDDQLEFSQVQTSLYTVFKLNPKSTLNEIFNQINTAVVETVRKRAIKFLVARIPMLLKDSPEDSKEYPKGLEDAIVKHVKQALIDVDAEEFILFIRLLTALPSMNTLTGRQELVNIIMAQSELDKPFEENDLERIMILLSCIQQALPLFSKNVQSTKFVNYYLANLLSIFTKLTDQSVTFDILKSFAELCSYYNGLNKSDNSVQNLEILYNLMIEYLPKPNEAETDEDIKFNFSCVECLMYAFHALGRFHPEFLAADENKDRLKDFRLRLGYFARGTQNYIKELRTALTNTSITVKESEENKVRRVALKITTNIDVLIKDLFHNPPSYKSVVSLSWKQVEQPTNTLAPKRSISHSNIDSSENDHSKKPTRGVYTPPTGKYTTNVTFEKSDETTKANGGQQQNGKRRTFSHGDRGRGGSRRGRGGKFF